jgi:hypothetical protein
MSDMDQSVWTPNSCEAHDGDNECNYDGCRDDADWDVELLGEGSRQGQKGLVRACDDHVACYWAYHPDEESVTDGGTSDTDRTSEPVVVEWRGGLDNHHSVKVDPYDGEITINGRKFAIGSLEDPNVPDWMYREVQTDIEREGTQ